MRSIDFGLLSDLVNDLNSSDDSQKRTRVPEPVKVHRLPRTESDQEARRISTEVGELAISSGQVAVVIVAGGQGTRLGFDGPKGTYPIGPVSACSLFEIHAEKVAALGRRYDRALPLYVMTSPENDSATRAFFHQHKNFGLEHVRFFVQGLMPAISADSGEVLLASPGCVAMSPDGHGGTLAALASSGPAGEPSCLDEMRAAGINTLFYFQVDNPMVRIADPSFIGLHLQAKADVSFKVVEKVEPDEKVGVVVELEGRPEVIEYSDLPPELANLREPDGRLRLWAGSIAIHAFDRAFIERIVGGSELPFHRAIKKVKHLDDRGQLIIPDRPNAVKFERFIFDTLPLASRYTVVETDRKLEFEPLKNASGPDSPATVRQRMSDVFGGWLESVGANVTRRPDGSIPFGIEISPLFALDEEELRGKIAPGTTVEAPLLLRHSN